MREIYDPNKRYEFPEICAACKNPCCAKEPCFYLPEDMKPFSAKHIIKLIEEKQYISIAFIQKVKSEILPKPIIYLRTRANGRPIIDSISNKGRCMLLTEKGCIHEYEDRPTGAKALVYHEEYNQCYSLFTVKQIINKWAKKQTTMNIVLSYFLKQEQSIALQFDSNISEEERMELLFQNMFENLLGGTLGNYERNL